MTAAPDGAAKDRRTSPYSIPRACRTWPPSTRRISTPPGSRTWSSTVYEGGAMTAARPGKVLYGPGKKW